MFVEENNSLQYENNNEKSYLRQTFASYNQSKWPDLNLRLLKYIDSELSKAINTNKAKPPLPLAPKSKPKK